MSDNREVTEALKPCPFECGHPISPVPSGWLVGTARELGMATDQWAYAVRCCCGAEGPERDTEAKAIAAWNTRAQSPATEDSELIEAERRLASLPSPATVALQGEVERIVDAVASHAMALQHPEKGPVVALDRKAAVEAVRSVIWECSGDDCELCSKPLSHGQFVNQYDDIGTAHVNCDRPFARPSQPTPSPNDDGSTMPTYVLLGEPLTLETLSAPKEGHKGFPHDIGRGCVQSSEGSL